MDQETRDPNGLRPHPLNATIYGEPDADPAFVESIREEGIIAPLTIDQDDNIISGHRRWYAALALGLDRVPVVVRAITDPLDAIRLLIEANRQRARTYSQRMREADEWAGVMAAQAQARMVDGGRRFGRGMGEPDRVAPFGATLSADGDVDAATERYNERRNRTFQRERYIWHIAEERGGDREAASLVARALVQKLDARAISVSAAEAQLREAVETTERRAALPPESPRPLHPEHADPWDEPDADPDAGLYSRPEPPAPEWPRGATAATYDTGTLADAPAQAAEAERALATLNAGRLPLPPQPLRDESAEHERALAGLDRLTGGKLQRDRALRTVENAINTIATQDAATVAQAADEDTLARTFEASVTNLEHWIGRYRAARADRHRVVSFVQKGD